ncbi:hypothetical protein quinque_000378 [Culex quinquefasciatus]
MFCGSAPVENCIEPDFTVAGSLEWDRKLTPGERAEVLFAPAKFRYLNPPAKDPLVDPDWPLAAFWPAYLSNFMVNNWIDQWNALKHWYAQVSDFFAYKGFQTRMIYFHTLDSDYLQLQKKNMLIEALVYFGSEEEAERAIATCHRCRYFGHWLNVLPGRTPEYFCNELSVRLVKGPAPTSESHLEHSLRPFAKVKLAIRHSIGNILVQFSSKEGMLKALASQANWKPIQLMEPVRIQRFLESDVKMGIQWEMEKQPDFLTQRPRRKIWQYFEDGIQPIVDNTWTIDDTPKQSKCLKLEKKLKKQKIKAASKRRLMKQNFQKYMKTEEYKNMSQAEKNALCEETYRTYGFNPLETKGPSKAQTPRQRKASVLKSVNWFLKQSGKPTLTKADQLKKRSERDKRLQMAKDGDRRWTERSEMFCGSPQELDCIEPDFTVSGAKGWGRRLALAADGLFVPTDNFVRDPARADPLVTDPKWPLATFWPVYLSNFLVDEWDERFWYDPVSDFFAHHGLETRMIYFHTLDAEFLEVQRNCSLIDALVYFSSEEEAKMAMAMCHRSLYYGHKLNVLPGRSPVYFCNERSARLVRHDVEASQRPETSLENVLTPFGRVEFTTRQSEHTILMEFTNTDCLVQALSSQNTWKPVQMSGQIQKQRFVEADVKNGLIWAVESQEGFLQQRPRPEVAKYFDDGIRPVVETCWRPRQLPRLSREKQERDAHLKELWKKKKKEVHFSQLSKWQKDKLYQDVCKEAGYGMKPGKKAKKLQAGVLKSINWFLRTRDKPTLTRDAMVERVKLRNTVLNVLHVANLKSA